MIMLPLSQMPPGTGQCRSPCRSTYSNVAHPDFGGFAVRLQTGGTTLQLSALQFIISAFNESYVFLCKQMDILFQSVNLFIVLLLSTREPLVAESPVLAMSGHPPNLSSRGFHLAKCLHNSISLQHFTRHVLCR
jgi:hypothetical protein